MNIRTLPLIRLLLAYLAGIIICETTAPTPFWMQITGYGLIVATLAWALLNLMHNWYPSRWVIGLLILPSMFCAGWLNTLRYQTTTMTDPLIGINEPNQWVAEVVSMPDHRSNSIRANAKLIMVTSDSATQKTETGVLLYFPATIEKAAQIGDLIAGYGQLRPIPKPLNPGAFDYKTYLARKGVTRQVWLPQEDFKILKKKAPRNLVYYSELIRKKLIDIIGQKITDRNINAVACAILLGYDELLDADLRRTYSGTGAMHVLCVSGLHVSIFYAIFAALLFPLSRSRKGEMMKTIILLVLIWGYASLTGLSTSVARSATMFTFVAIGKGFRRRTSVLNSLLASAFFLLAINPYSLYDIGFQLSFAAVTGIVTFQPVLAQWWFTENKIVMYIRDLITVSIAAQLFTMPITLLNFHQFPNYFILSNMIVIPLSFLILVSGMATIAFWWVPGIGNGLAWILSHLIWMMNKGVTIVEKLPGSISFIPVFSLAETILLLIIVTALLFWLVMRKKQGLLVALCSLLALTVSTQFQRYKYSKQHELVIADGGKQILFGTIQGRNALWVGSAPTPPTFSINGMNQYYAISPDRWRYKQLNDDTTCTTKNFVVFAGKRLIVIDGDFQIPKTTSRLQADLVIVGKHPKIRPEWIVPRIEGAEWILSSSMSDYNRHRWEASCEQTKCSVHSIDSLGAKVITLR